MFVLLLLLPTAAAGLALQPPSAVSRPPLDPDQQRALRLALAGHNLFLTGGAGVGKSFTLRTIIAALEELHGERHVAVTASTGTASVHVDGQTLHTRPIRLRKVPKARQCLRTAAGQSGPQRV